MLLNGWMDFTEAQVVLVSDR